VKATRPRDLFAVGLVVAVLAALVIRLSYGSLPPIPVLAGAPFGVLGIAEAIAGNALRARIRRRPGSEPVQPLVAARAVVVAKASALAGAIMAGVWAGLLVHVVPQAGDITAAAGDSLSGAVALACALGLVAGALWLEHCCRAPDDEPGGESNGRATGADHP
jgi:predicted outer membrane lipoprotein